MSNPYIVTATGQWFDLVDPQPDMVNLIDIQYALSRQQRFTGHTYVNCNIALHSIMVSETAANSEVKLQALMHDAHEAYTGDIAGPLKSLLGPELAEIESRIDKVIAEALGYELKEEYSDVIKKADLACLNFEMAVFMRSIKPGEYPIAAVESCVPKPETYALYFKDSEESETAFGQCFRKLSR